MSSYRDILIERVFHSVPETQVQLRTGSGPDLPLPLMEVESKPISSPARMIGVNLQSYNREGQSGLSKGRVELAILRVCLISLFAAMGLSDLDGLFHLHSYDLSHPPSRCNSSTPGTTVRRDI